MNVIIRPESASFSYIAHHPALASWLGAEARCRDGSGLARYVAAYTKHPDRLGMVEATPRTLSPNPCRCRQGAAHE